MFGLTPVSNQVSHSHSSACPQWGGESEGGWDEKHDNKRNKINNNNNNNNCNDKKWERGRNKTQEKEVMHDTVA